MPLARGPIGYDSARRIRCFTAGGERHLHQFDVPVEDFVPGEVVKRLGQLRELEVLRRGGAAIALLPPSTILDAEDLEDLDEAPENEVEEAEEKVLDQATKQTGVDAAFLDANLAGEPVDAVTAQSLGLVNRVVAPGTERDAAIALAQKVALKSAYTVKLGKEAFYRQAEMSLADAYRYAAEVMTENMMARDAEEGIGAFIEKRDPKWEDK